MKQGRSHLLLFSTVDDFLRGAIAASHGTVHRAVMPGFISGLAGKKQRVFDRSAQRLLCPVRSDLGVAVCASREWIGLPVMEISCVQPGFRILHFYTEQSG